MFFSIITATYKRPAEVKEFLESLVLQKNKNFEIIIADGSPDNSIAPVVNEFKNKLNIKYIYQYNLPVSNARNKAAEIAKGEYLIFLDSDCIIPDNYLNIVKQYIKTYKCDAFGGTDDAMDNFTPLQKAINYTMTSFLSSGGIRGKKTHIGKFYPRGFNMGVKKNIFLKEGGFSEYLVCGEDIDLSIRLSKKNYKISLISDAIVYHKRRTNLKKFYKQLFRFGAARIILYNIHNDLKITHLFPLFFSAYTISLLFIPFILKKYFIIFFIIYFAYVTAIFFHSLFIYKSVYVSFLTVISLFVQFFAYAHGFIINFNEVFIKRNKKGIKI